MALDIKPRSRYASGMPLEDHVGDIIRKSRLGLGIPANRVATVGRITPEHLAEFEEHGQPRGGVHFAGISELLTLDGTKVEALLDGWEPSNHDITRWHHLRQIETDDGGMAVNCFLVWDQDSGAAGLFDTGWTLRPIQTYLKQQRLQLQHLFLTHSHHDHIAALGAIRKLAPELRLHSKIQGAPAEQRLNPGDEFEIGTLRVRFRGTPGHAEDGVTYLIDGFPNQVPAIAIVGDAIFAGSMGGARTHFDLARTKIREEILSLPGDTLLCPGHGPITTVAEELAHNPFFH